MKNTTKQFVSTKFNFYKRFFFFSNTRQSSTKSFLTVILAMGIAIFLSAIFANIFDSKHTGAFNIIGALFTEWNTSPSLRTETVFQMVVLALSALSFLTAFKSGIFNIGVSGQMLMSGTSVFLLAKAFGPNVPNGLGQVIMMFFAIIIGGTVALIISLLKNLFRIHEVVSSILINWIILYLTNYLKGIYLNTATPPQVSIRSDELSANYSLNTLHLTESGNIAWLPGLIIMIIIAAFIFILFRYTVFGKKMISISKSVSASKYAGYKINLYQNASMVLSGMIAGILGYVFYGQKTEGLEINETFLPLEGFNGIAVSLIALSSPIWVILSAFVISVLNNSVSSSSIINDALSFKDLISGFVMYIVAIFNVFLFFKPWKYGIKFVLGKENSLNYDSFISKMDLLILETHNKLKDLKKQKPTIKTTQRLEQQANDQTQNNWFQTKLNNSKVNRHEKQIKQLKILNEFEKEYLVLKRNFYGSLSVSLEKKLQSLNLYNWIFKIKYFYVIWRHKIVDSFLLNKKLIKNKVEVLKLKQKDLAYEKTETNQFYSKYDQFMNSLGNKTNQMVFKFKKLVKWPGWNEDKSLVAVLQRIDEISEKINQKEIDFQSFKKQKLEEIKKSKNGFVQLNYSKVLYYQTWFTKKHQLLKQKTIKEGGQ